MQIVNPRDIGREVRCARRRYMLRQADVARAVGVSRQWVSALENGKATLDLGLVLRAFDMLGLDLVAKLRADPPGWTVPLTAAAELREWQSLSRACHRRLEVRARVRAIREGNLTLGPGDALSDDLDLADRVRASRRRQAPHR